MEVPKIKVKPPGPEAAALIERDSRVAAPAYGRVYPLVMKQGRGCVVEDVDGNLYLDFMAGIAVASTGHSHPKVVAAIEEQARKFLHICGSDFYYEPMVRLTEQLSRLTPGNGAKRVFLTNSGTEAIEAAFKLARYATRRKHVIAFFGAFHGRTMGSLSLTASRASHRAFFSPFVPDVHHVPFPNCRAHRDRVDHSDCGSESVDYIERVVFRHEVVPEEVAAIFVEPIQGEGGYVVPPDDFLPRLHDLCRRHGILLVADEIQSGFGRTGKMFACEHWNIVPDIICVAKGIASGMPLGAMIAREEVSTWPRSSHGSTFGGNPVACAAALATIEVIENGLVANAAEQGSYLKQRLVELKAGHTGIADVRGLGLMIGVEFQQSADRMPAAQLRDSVVRRCFESGLLVLGCGESTLRFCPPLIVSRAEVDNALQVFGAVLDETNC